MIAKQTTLILGAGASIPYGLPSGFRLRAQILGFESSSQPLNKFAALFVESESGRQAKRDEALRFIEAFRGSKSDSIDAFLETREDLIDIGKALIAYALLPKENYPHIDKAESERASNPNKNEDWYTHLWNEWLRPSMPDELTNNRLGVVTFNYDRSFEAFLVRAVANSFSISADDSWSYVSGIPFAHIHGTLSEPGPNYASSLDAASISGAVERISIVSEAIKRRRVLAQAENMIRESQNVLFLGFGFHPINVDRLLGTGAFSDKQFIGGTCMGIHPQKVKFRVKPKFTREYGLPVQLEDTSCLKYLESNPKLFLP